MFPNYIKNKLRENKSQITAYSTTPEIVNDSDSDQPEGAD
jgi:hypothetical protein